MPAERPTLILMPGFDGTGELFSPLRAELGDWPTRTVRYANEATLEDCVERVRAELPDDDVMLVAESFSGPVALALLAHERRRVRGAVLCATFALSPLRWLTRLAALTPSAMLAANSGRRALLRHFCLNGSTDLQLMEQALSTIRSVPGAVVKQRLGILSRVDVRPLCHAVEVPILILRPTADRIVNASLHRQLVATLPRSLVSEVAGPHLLLQSQPRACARLIQKFATDPAIRT